MINPFAMVIHRRIVARWNVSIFKHTQSTRDAENMVSLRNSISNHTTNQSDEKKELFETQNQSDDFIILFSIPSGAWNKK